jgi:hypothetical protein
MKKRKKKQKKKKVVIPNILRETVTLDEYVLLPGRGRVEFGKTLVWSRHKGYTVFRADNLPEALAFVKENSDDRKENTNVVK